MYDVMSTLPTLYTLY